MRARRDRRGAGQGWVRGACAAWDSPYVLESRAGARALSAGDDCQHLFPDPGHTRNDRTISGVAAIGTLSIAIGLAVLYKRRTAPIAISLFVVLFVILAAVAGIRTALSS